MDTDRFMESGTMHSPVRRYIYVVALFASMVILYHALHQYTVDTAIGAYVFLPMILFAIFITATRAPLAAVVLSITVISTIAYT